MYLRDYLHDIPLKALKSIAQSLDVNVEYQARIKLINAIDRAFWDGTLLERILNVLPDDYRRVLACIAFSYDRGADEKTLMKKLEKNCGLSRETSYKILSRLTSQALIGGIREHDSIYFCPRGPAEQIRSWFIKCEPAVSNRTLPAPSASPPNLMEDVFSLLAVVYKDEAPLTLTGKIKKSVLDRAFEGSPTCTENRNLFSEEIRNSLVVDYLKKRGLLSYEFRKAKATETLHSWLELSMTERIQDITAFCLAAVFQDDSTVVPFTGILTEIPAGSVFEPSRFAHFLYHNTLALGNVGKLETKVKDMFIILAQLGLFSFSGSGFVMTKNGERIFRNENLPIDEKISGTFTVQPNFEIIVGPELDPRVRFKLELLSSRVNRDMVLTYIVTQRGIARAREHGMSTDEVISFFNVHSKNPLPQNVKFSIESWAREYGSIYFEEAFLMRFHDPAVCQTVKHISDITKYVKEQLSTTVLAVNPKNVKLITFHLKKAGYQPELYGSKFEEGSEKTTVFVPDTVLKLFEKNRIPDFHNDLIISENLIPGEGK